MRDGTYVSSTRHASRVSASVASGECRSTQSRYVSAALVRSAVGRRLLKVEVRELVICCDSGCDGS
jgi:hypothetical protein